jgi:muramoyltetrapeptide carboxypeptidase
VKTRRSLLADAALASAFLALPRGARAATTPAGPVRPKALGPGTRVALVSPASPEEEPEGVAIAEEVVRSLGLVPKTMPAAARQTMYLAGSDEERAADLNAAFRDPSVDAIWCVRGGYGSGRLLPLLDWDAIRKNPKPLLGFSDITALLGGIYARTGLVTFHAPNCSSNLSEYSLAELKKVAFSKEAAGIVAAAPPVEPREGWVDRDDRLRRIAPGTGRGRLVGGNISVFSTLVGTPWEPPLEGAILFLEEVGEEPYRIDRWLTHFVLTGRLAKCAGIVLGKFKDCVPPDKGSFQGSWTWQAVAADRLGKLGIPVLAGLRFGHVADKATFPLGVLAELDVAKGTLALLEPAVA